MKYRRILNISIIILTFILLAALLAGFLKQSSLNSKNKDDYKEWMETNSTLVSDTNMPLTESTSFYWKILNKENVNILVLGDEISLSEGITDKSYGWTSYLSQWIEYTYLVKANITCLGEKGALISDGNTTFDSNINSLDFDMVIICYGIHDSLNETDPIEFRQSYSDLIGKIKSVNYECKIITLIPPDITIKKDYIDSINLVSQLNNVKVIDILHTFTNLHNKSEILVVDNLPTEKGYAVFAEAIETYIKYFLKN